MPSAREINRRIKSVTNTQQITKAMKMVSSVRLRHAQDRALATAPYTEKMEGMLQRLSAASPDDGIALFTPHEEVKKTCYIIVGSDKGLAGAFNSNVNKAMVSVLKDKPRAASMLLVAGRKPVEYLKHLRLTPDKKWSGFSDKPELHHAQEISRTAVNAFLDGTVDEVYIIYTHFKSALSQDTRIVKMLPITQKEDKQQGPKEEYLFAPDPQQVLESLLPKYLDLVVYNSLLQSAASELGARMTAMTSATDNAGDLIDKLTVTYNKVRQAGITNELTEIVSGANALQ